MKSPPPPGRATAFTLIELLVVLLIVGLLVGLLVPTMITARKEAQRISCVSHLKIIGLAFRIWSGDNTNLYPMSVSTNFGGTKELIATGETFRHFQVMSNELNTPKLLACPTDRQRWPAPDFGPSFSNTNVSYFVGLDASEDQPQMLLSGDRNILGGTRQANGILALTTNDFVRWSRGLHGDTGNVGMADGSVQQVSSAKLRDALANTGVVTNRLQMP